MKARSVAALLIPLLQIHHGIEVLACKVCSYTTSRLKGLGFAGEFKVNILKGSLLSSN
jgi:hypothetical protein